MIITNKFCQFAIPRNYWKQCLNQRFYFSNLQNDQQSTPQKTESDQKQKGKGYLNKLREEYITNAIAVSLNQKTKVKAKEEYRAAILFEEVLNREIDINLYDTKGRAYYFHTFGNIFWVLFAGFGLYTVFWDDYWYKKKMEVFKVVITTCFIFTRFIKQRQFYKYQVEKLSYNTKNKNFTMVKRNVLGMKKEQVLPKDQLLYTSDQDLNKKRINYININTLECYGIGFDYAWIKKDLFSHLIQQNIS